MSDANAVILLSFEDELAMATGQFRALGDTLARAGCPIRNSIPIAGGWIIDHNGDSTETVGFSTAAGSNAAPSLMLRIHTAEKMAAGIPARTTGANATGRRKFIAETRVVVRGTLTDMVEGCRHRGKLTPGHAGGPKVWIRASPRIRGISTLFTGPEAPKFHPAHAEGAIQPVAFPVFRSIFSHSLVHPRASRIDLFIGGAAQLSTR